MKIPCLFSFLAAALLAPALILAQTPDRTSVTRDASGNLINGFTVPSGKTVSVAAGGTLAVAGNVTADGKTIAPAELGALDGVSGPIQTAIDAKLAAATAATTYAPLASPTLTGTVVLPSTTSIGGTTPSTFGRSLWDDADATAARATLGLAAVASSGSAADLATGTLPSARLPVEALRRSSASVSGPRFAALSQGLQVSVSTGVTTGYTAGSFRWWHKTLRPAEYLQLVFVGTYNNGGVETNIANPVEVKAAIELPNGVTRAVYFQGRRLALLRPGAVLRSDPLYAPVAADEQLYTRTFFSRLASSSYTSAGESGLLAADQTSVYAHAYNLGQVNGNGDSYVVTTSTSIDPFTLDDVDDTGAMSTNGNFLAPAPTLLGSVGVDASRAVCILGTSIEMGVGDGWVAPAGMGWAARAATAAGLPSISVALASSTLQASLAAPSGAYARGALFAAGDIIILGAPTNDGIAGRTFAQMQADAITLSTRLRNLGHTVLLATMFPRTSSSDGWVTVANQTLPAWEAHRLAWNAWVRTDPAEADGFVDPAGPCEDVSGKWIAATVADSGTATNTSSSSWQDTTKSWTTNQWAGYVLQNTTAGTRAVILYNTSNSLIASLAHNSGDSYTISAQPTADGIHPSGYGHGLAAAAAEPVLESLPWAP